MRAVTVCISEDVFVGCSIAGSSPTVWLPPGARPRGRTRAERCPLTCACASRLFFCTPQSFHNDIENGAVDPLRIVLVVFDEAHRASGGCMSVRAVLCIKESLLCRCPSLANRGGGYWMGFSEEVNTQYTSQKCKVSLPVTHDSVHSRQRGQPAVCSQRA